MTKRKGSKVRKAIVEALERKVAGPIFGQANSSLFRLAVGSFFGVKSIGEMQEEIEKKALEMIKKELKEVHDTLKK